MLGFTTNPFEDTPEGWCRFAKRNGFGLVSLMLWGPKGDPSQVDVQVLKEARKGLTLAFNIHDSTFANKFYGECVYRAGKKYIWDCLRLAAKVKPDYVLMKPNYTYSFFDNKIEKETWKRFKKDLKDYLDYCKKKGLKLILNVDDKEEFKAIDNLKIAGGMWQFKNLKPHVDKLVFMQMDQIEPWDELKPIKVGKKERKALKWLKKKGFDGALVIGYFSGYNKKEILQSKKKLVRIWK